MFKLLLAGCRGFAGLGFSTGGSGCKGLVLAPRGGPVQFFKWPTTLNNVQRGLLQGLCEPVGAALQTTTTAGAEIITNIISRSI